MVLAICPIRWEVNPDRTRFHVRSPWLIRVDAPRLASPSRSTPGARAEARPLCDKSSVARPPRASNRRASHFCTGMQAPGAEAPLRGAGAPVPIRFAAGMFRLKDARHTDVCRPSQVPVVQAHPSLGAPSYVFAPGNGSPCHSHAASSISTQLCRVTLADVSCTSTVALSANGAQPFHSLPDEQSQPALGEASASGRARITLYKETGRYNLGCDVIRQFPRCHFPARIAI
jgi:hypothetical protein